jgi:hypothetical protein
LFVAPVRGEVDKYQVYAVRFATIANVRAARLVAGADAARRMDIAMMIWVLKGIDGRVAIMDSGSVSNLRAQDRMRSLASDPRPRPCRLRSLSARQRTHRPDRMTRCAPRNSGRR